MSSKNKCYRVDLWPLNMLVLDTIRENDHLFSVPRVAGVRLASELSELFDLYDDVVVDGSKSPMAVKAHNVLNSMAGELSAALFKIAFGDYYKTVPEGYDLDFAELLYRRLDTDIVLEMCKQHGQKYTEFDGDEFRAGDPLAEDLVSRGLAYLDDAYAMAQDLVSGLEKCPWLLYDVRYLDKFVVVKFGKDIRHVLFEEKYGNDRWDGEIYMIDGTKAMDVFISRIGDSNNRGRKFSTKMRKIL